MGGNGEGRECESGGGLGCEWGEEIENVAGGDGFNQFDTTIVMCTVLSLKYVNLIVL